MKLASKIQTASVSENRFIQIDLKPSNTVKLAKTLFVLEVSKNVLSKITQRREVSSFQEEQSRRQNTKGEIVLQAKSLNDLYLVHGGVNNLYESCRKLSDLKMEKWRKCLDQLTEVYRRC